MTSASWDINNKHSSIILSNNNLTANGGGTNNVYVGLKATPQQTVTTKYYYEVTVDSLTNRILIGVANNTVDTSTNYGTGAGAIPAGVKGLMNTGIIYSGGATIANGTYVVSDTIGIAFDRSIGKLDFYKNGTFLSTVTSLDTKEAWFPYAIVYSATDKITANFGNTAFKYQIPDGYESYNQNINRILFQKNDKFYSLKSNSIIHVTNMTSNALPSPLKSLASAESEANYAAWKAFNGSNLTAMDSWRTSTNIRTGWIRLDFGVSTKVNKLTLTSPNDSSVIPAMPKDFIIEGSNDTSTFTPIKSFTGQTWGVNEAKVYEFDSLVEYRFFRISVSKTHRLSDGSETSGTLAIGEILYSYDAPHTIREFSAPTVNNFVEYGVDLIDGLEKGINEKQYVLQDTVSENEQGLWTVQLNRKPLSIRFD